MNGLLVLDKPAGMTSHDVVYAVRRATGEKSVGHMGTLDPMATGVLPLLLGKYTRLAQFYGQAEKAYTGTIRFGFATDTYDAEGVAAGDAVPLEKSLDELKILAAEFLGESMQMPPVYSAKKIAGTPAYKLARAGKPVEVKAARVVIDQFDLLEQAGDCVQFSMAISAGGYVRSVAHELGQRAGCGAHLASLRRTRAGVFTLEQAITLDTMQSLVAAGELEANMQHPRTLLPEMPCVTADESTAGRIRNGMAVNLPEFSCAALVKVFTNQRELLAIGRRVAGTLIQPMVVLG
jgi:tRNA pseudouridine55 synthase